MRILNGERKLLEQCLLLGSAVLLTSMTDLKASLLADLI
jgi:hypothetical protein